MNWFDRNYAYSIFDEYTSFYSNRMFTEHLPKGEINQYGQAMLGVADFLDKNPTKYFFGNNCVPEAHQKGCLIGIAARSAGIPAGIPVGKVCGQVFGMPESEFYIRMFNESDPVYHLHMWQRSAKEAARLLRRLARRQTMKV